MELALRPVEKPPTLEEVLEQVSTSGVLRGPVDWVFPAWMLCVECATQKIAETFPLSEKERRQFFHFRDTMKRHLLEAWMQAKEKLTALYKAVAEGTYKLEGKRLYAPDGVWMYIGGSTPHLKIHGVSALARFPDLLKLPHERLELFQLGWRASDEGEKGGRPLMSTTQPWQVFAWTATRYGALYIRIDTVILTHEGVSMSIQIKAKSWRQRWSKNEAIDLVADYLRREEWAPLLIAWLGEGEAKQKKVLHSRYELVIAAKEPWRLGNSISTRKALVASGKEAFRRLRESAGVYGELLDLLKAHKWVSIKLATDDGFKVALKLNKMNITVGGIVMHLRLVGGRGISLLAGYFTRDVGEALAAVDKLKAAGLRPNIVRSGSNYMVYIATADLLKLAEKDETIRRTIALYLAEKAKSGTPRQREIAEKLLKRYPLFSINRLAAFSTMPCVSRYRTQAPSLANMWNCRADDSQHRPASSRADNSQKSPVALYGILRGLGLQFFAPFHAAGGLFFLYLAYKIGTAKPPQVGSAGGGHPLRGYLLGLSLGLVNPCQVGWGLTAGLSSIASFGVEWAAGLFLAILTWITAFPAAVRSGWRLNSRLTWLAVKFFSVTVLAVFGVLFIYTAASLVLGEG